MSRFAALFLLALSAFAQSPDATLTQTLINEIHALRTELQATNVTSQRVQIALYRLQSQTALVTVAQQRLDTARSKTAAVRSEGRDIGDELKRQEELFRNTSPDDKKNVEGMIGRLRTAQESLVSREGLQRSAELDAESQLRAEQVKLADLQSILDRLDKALDELARPKR